MFAFLTGSRAYGTPTEESDIDLVVPIYSEDAAVLWKAMPPETKSVRFGKLNLIICDLNTEHGAEKFEKWREVTCALIQRAPVTREEAVAAFQEVGIGGDYTAP